MNQVSLGLKIYKTQLNSSRLKKKLIIFIVGIDISLLRETQIEWNYEESLRCSVEKTDVSLWSCLWILSQGRASFMNEDPFKIEEKIIIYVDIDQIYIFPCRKSKRFSWNHIMLNHASMKNDTEKLQGCHTRYDWKQL